MRIYQLLPLILAPAVLFGGFSDLKLDLYYRPSCPYCVKVLKVIKKLEAPVVFHDISAHPEEAKILIKTGGKQQVPCLFINGKPMYESNDIIAWLEKESERSN